MESSNGFDEADEGLVMSLEELTSISTYKWIFVGGKGGVGKTTTACAISVQLAKIRKSVLVLSTDPAHNLSDAFGQKLSNRPSFISGFSNLSAMEIDPSSDESQGFQLNSSNSFTSILPELLKSLPGIDEALSFTELMHAVQNMDYDVIIFDTAPTGHTIRLLGFPEVIENALNKFAGVKSQFAGAINMMNMVSGQTVDETDMFAKIDHLKAVTASIRDTFQDPTKTTFVCVCIAEFLSVYETERLVQELTKQNIDCSNIVVNQVLFPIKDDDGDDLSPEPVTASSKIDELTFLKKENLMLKRRIAGLEKAYYNRRRMQSKYLHQIRDLYSFEFHVVCIPQQEAEIRGKKGLEGFGELLVKPSILPIVEEE